ncbi:hypothetical protein KTJ16_00505 [Acinetobacter bereziniae]|jgi:membrane protein CcdC involved in cytochrome C biogenesis|uniref:hypothetical protein n=1 Tax=Acinetobacter TaxID=469 RepID=UPI000B3CC5C9|nr:MULTISPECIES: hypothetical protein [Acinetobacter]AYA69806.1 hypothetical protein CDG62_16655 [Acinetobacter sp. WCHA55]MBJ8422715.1 hypothetical protein [Acinetobacter bereziniae]MCU4539660.1 hypothetical protein [Acinetobacter bereziniae]MCU4624161.1 hypothetical protein [Acinetobacter bereziniae]
MIVWLRFLIIPTLFNLTFVGASNFAMQYNNLLGISILLIFLWLVGFTAYFFSPYRSLFFALTLIGLLVGKNIFKILTSNAFQEDLIHPAFLIAFVFFAPYLGLWKAWRNKYHLDNFIRKNEITN